jgi:cholesterol oxidase
VEGRFRSAGVVSPNGEVFGYPNLFVDNGPIVPSSLGPNPSKTVDALARRISDQLIQKGIA